MPEYLAPGVFVEETSFRQKTIEGVGTSTAAFIGPTRFGPVSGVPELLTSFGDFERIYGGVDRFRDDADKSVDNYVAHGVRAFFENGGRRCYVARVRDSSLTDDQGFAKNSIPAAKSPGDPELWLRARYPGRAGNFQVQFTLRMSANVLKLANASGPTQLLGAFEYQVVWLDKIKDGPNQRIGQFAYLEDVFDEEKKVWTFHLRNSTAAEAESFGMVSRLDPTITKDIRILTVDVEAGPLGEFMDPMVWQGLGLHWQDRNSIQQMFGPNGKVRRATELSVPLMVGAESQKLDGPTLANLLIREAGATAGVTGKAWEVSVAGAVGGTFAIVVDKVATDPIAFNAKASVVQGALRAAPLGVVHAMADGPEGGSWMVSVPADAKVDQLRVDGSKLISSGDVIIRRAAVWQFQPVKDKRFRISIDDKSSSWIWPTAPPDEVDAALETLVGIGRVRVTRLDAAGGYTYVVTVFADDDINLVVTTQDAHDVTVGAPDRVLVVRVDADAGTFTFNGPEGRTDVELGKPTTDVGGALQAVFNLQGAPKEEDGEFVIETRDKLTVENANLTSSTGSATVQVTELADSLTVAGSSASIGVRLAGGSDGGWPDGDGYGGQDRLDKSGLFALRDLPDVSIVAAPGSTTDYDPEDSQAKSKVLDRVGRVIRHCEYMRYRIAVIDAPPSQSPTQMVDFRGEFDSKHAALYYPWVRAYDPVARREQDFPPSGFVAGIYARNDAERGVHKAPANEVVALSVGFETHINTAQQELLNPLGVNCLRHLDQRGRRVWGARTMTSDPEWKYVNLRRYFAFLEASIDRGTQWAVFEPNGELLWANVRRTVEDFLLNEYASGHLLGAKPEQAFFVRCDRSTMTQNDLDNGRLVCLIGVAPLRPAEFVIFRIGQKTIDAAG